MIPEEEMGARDSSMKHDKQAEIQDKTGSDPQHRG